MSELLRFDPIYQNRVWGGRALEEELGRVLPDPSIPFGESWDLVDRPEACSVVNQGAFLGKTLHDLWSLHRHAVFGAALMAHPSPRFPILIKVLDAREDLSIQVHPPVKAAAQLGGDPKSEVWFVAGAKPDARLYAGLRNGVTREQFESALEDGSVANLVHPIPVQSGDFLSIPSGRVHAIGAGILIFEVQQNSDTTYRVFDWNRVGLDGKPRQLHLTESIQSIRFDDFEPSLSHPGPDGLIEDGEFFRMHLRKGSSAESHSVGQVGEMRIIMVTAGMIRDTSTTPLCRGDLAIVPASASPQQRNIVPVAPETRWLEMEVR